jgi:hypothetical protein
MDPWVGFLALIGGLAILAAYLANRWITPSHPPIDTGGLDLPPGLVVFTSTDCSNCGALMEMLRGTSAPIREVTFELESGLFERVGVDGVPLTVAIGEGGEVLGQAAGLPSQRALDKLVGLVSPS